MNLVDITVDITDYRFNEMQLPYHNLPHISQDEIINTIARQILETLLPCVYVKKR